MAFVLTVVLGAGSTIAYAYWSQSATVATISGTTRSEVPAVPAGTTLATANPALAARPGKVTALTCSTLATQEAMIPKTTTDIRFSWPSAASATSYVITIRSNSGGYAYQQTKTVSAATADFQFIRQQSVEGTGQPQAGPTPFYTDYTVRIMPMNGTVPGDPLYKTLRYAHWSSANCGDGLGAEAALASPVGSAAPVTCAPLSGTGKGGYSDLKVNWASSSGATSYSVTMMNADRSYGGEVSVAGTSASFRITRPSPESDKAPYFSTYSVRVQPMKGAQAGDPVYLQGYQFYTWGQTC